MKKKLILALVLSIAVTMTVPGIAFAADTATAAAPAYAAASATTASAMAFTTPAVKLSLSDTYKKLETSSTMELLKLDKLNDQSISKGLSESIQSLKKLESAASLDPTASLKYDSSDKKMAQANRKHANLLIEPNNTARINQFNKNTYEKYYKIKNMELQVSIAKDTLSVKQALLKSANLKFKAGSASKMDVLTAEMDVKSANDDYTAAQNGLASLKMEFNTYIGNPLMQEITLTDTLKETPLPEKTLQASIADAKTNRNEVLGAAYGLEMAQLNFDNYKAYPHSSSKYINAQSALTEAQIVSNNIAANMEMDVRVKYMNMLQAYQEVQSGKQNVANAMETARLADLQYTAGMCTLTDVQNAQLGSTLAQMKQAQALLDYFLAIEDYNYCSGVGVTAVKLAQ